MAGGVLRPVRRHVNMAKVRRVDRSRMAIGKCHVDAITMSVGNGNSVQSAVILIGRRGWSAGQRQFIAGNRYAITQPAGVGNALECCGIYGLPGRRGSICILECADVIDIVVIKLVGSIGTAEIRPSAAVGKHEGLGWVGNGLVIAVKRCGKAGAA